MNEMLWQEIAVFAIVGFAVWNLWRTFRGSFSDKSCGSGCGKCAASTSQPKEAPLIQIQMNGQSLKLPHHASRDEQNIGRN